MKIVLFARLYKILNFYPLKIELKFNSSKILFRNNEWWDSKMWKSMFLIIRKNYVLIWLQRRGKISIWSSSEEKEEDERKKKNQQAEDPGTKLAS